METLLGALLIFALRVIDVSLGTLRIVLLTRGDRWRAGLAGFFESLTWVVAASQVITNLDNPLRLVAFAAGFATGTVVGATVERWLAVGKCMIRIVTPASSVSVAPALRSAGFGVTVVDAEGMGGDVTIAFTVVPRRRADEVLSIVRHVEPEAFVTVEDVTTPRQATRRRLVRV